MKRNSPDHPLSTSLIMILEYVNKLQVSYSECTMWVDSVKVNVVHLTLVQCAHFCVLAILRLDDGGYKVLPS